MSRIIGIDVSEHNGKLDWAKIKAAGIGFAIVRTGYGVSHTDNQFTANMKGAIAQGIPVGIYHFSYALNAAGAKKEAEFVCKLLEPYKSQITMPVFFDFEYDTVTYAKKQGVSLGKEAFNSHTVAFCEAIKAAGYAAGVYYNLDYLRNFVDIDRIGQYTKWYAQYSSKASASSWALWQYSSSFTITGINGRFDVNLLGDESLLTSKGKYTLGWHKDSKGWWYADSANSYCKDCWKKIDGKWYFFGTDGYMEADMWTLSNGELYYLGADGAMAVDKALEIGSDGKVVPVDKAKRIKTMADSPDYAKETLQKLIDKGILRGTGGSGEDLVIDLGEDVVRALVLLDRAGNFGT